MRDKKIEGRGGREKIGDCFVFVYQIEKANRISLIFLFRYCQLRTIEESKTASCEWCFSSVFFVLSRRG